MNGLENSNKLYLLLLIPITAFVVFLGSKVVGNGRQGDEVPYKLLWSQDSTSVGSWINYRVSVDQHQDPKGFQALVCAVIDGEKPADYVRIKIFFYRSVKEYAKYVAEDSRLFKKRIATYFWNRDLVGEEGTRQLTVYIDKAGNTYSEALQFRFNHVEDCRAD